jgi:hypothetical protein
VSDTFVNHAIFCHFNIGENTYERRGRARGTRPDGRPHAPDRHMRSTTT